ncbi:MAG: methyltransferase [Nevskiaceae bacterium]|nr:MAG: methyltransferase [Nevskiaceae bacterium]TBR75158.1 MAG: methyltransferase [Nevskiaceae bacterium]
MVVAVGAAATVYASPVQVPAYVTAAMNDPARAADHVNDERRRMADVLVLTGIKPGDSVLELVPGGGYWTRAFSGIVGATGRVYTMWPERMQNFAPVHALLTKSLHNWRRLALTPHYANVTPMVQPAAEPWVPHAVDVVFTADNYHDLHQPYMGPLDMLAFDKRIYAALKPGGVYVIVDHEAAVGSNEMIDVNFLHRIDPALVRREVESAGFVFDGESRALKNSKDPLDVSIFDPSIRGHTSQFMFRFRKPRR